MELNRNQQLQASATNNNILQPQTVQPGQSTMDPRMANPMQRQVAQLHMSGQIRNARIHHVPFSPASYHRSAANPYAQQCFATNNGNMQPQHLQSLQQISISRITQAASHEVLSTQAHEQLSRTNSHGNPPHPNFQTHMSLDRGVKRKLAETHFTEPQPRYQPRPQSTFFRHAPSATSYKSIPMSLYYQDRSPSDQSYLTASILQEQVHTSERTHTITSPLQDHVQQIQQPQMMHFHCQNPTHTPQLTQMLNTNSYTQQFISGYTAVEAAYQQPEVRHQGPAQPHTAVPENTPRTQAHDPALQLTTLQRTGIYLAQNPRVRECALQPQSPSQPLQARGRQQSTHDSSNTIIDLTKDDVSPLLQQIALVPIQKPSSVAVQLHTGISQIQPPNNPGRMKGKPTNDGAVVRTIPPYGVIPGTVGNHGSEQSRADPLDAPATTAFSSDEALDRPLLEAITKTKAPEINSLKHTTTSNRQDEGTSTQSLPDMAVSTSATPASTASSQRLQMPSSAQSTPPPGSDAARPDSITSETPPVWRADGRCQPEHISPGYRITPESEIQANLNAALAREDAKEEAANEDDNIGDETCPAAVLHVPVPASSISWQREQALLANLIPTPSYHLPNLNAPVPGSHEATFKDFRKKAREAARKGRGEPKGSKASGEDEIYEVWDGNVADRRVMVGLFARIVREEEELERAI